MTSLQIRKPIEDALDDFSKWLVASGWRGRENEVVNQFAHRCLPKRFSGPLHSMEQIGIEVAVEQVRDDSAHRKANVRKDLVIWRDGNEVVYDNKWLVNVAPLAVLEWKARTTSIYAGDLNWLRTFTSIHPETLGVAVAVAFAPAVVRVKFVENGVEGPEIVLPAGR